jgi:hypothetical protein
MFFLTRAEQAVIAFILISLVIGAGVRHFRIMKRLPGNQVTVQPTAAS